MTTPLPDFDPYELLGLDVSADAATVDRAYKARVRHVHPDIAGIAGLDETKRLNIAREWLLDPDLRAQLPPPPPRWGPRPTSGSAPPPPPETPTPSPSPSPKPPPRTARSTSTDWYWEGRAEPPPKQPWEYDPETDDPLAFDYGPGAEAIKAFFDSIRSLTPDERARVTHSLGEEPPLLFEDFEELVGERLWARSCALEDAIEQVWRERLDEQPPLLFPRGRVFGNGAVVANAYAQWLLLGEAIGRKVPERAAVEALRRRCTAAWAASVGHARYGGQQEAVTACLDDARAMSLTSAERLARAWARDMGGFLYGRPGEDWFPGSLDHPGPALVSARLAAVDASRIEPPEQMRYEQRNDFRCGLRLTAYVLGLGGVNEPGRDYLRSWKEALDPNPSFADRARFGLPRG